METAASHCSDPLACLDPSIQRWFRTRHGHPTRVQAQAWPVIADGGHVLVSGPTGSGKSLAAWLPLISRLAHTSSSRGVRLLYVSPLRALSRDMATGLAECLAGLAEITPFGAGRLSYGVRTGDTPAAERASQRRQPPDILLTTPESLFVLLGSRGGRSMLATTEAVIVDEAHALATDKRGAHLALSLERLDQLCAGRLQRVGLSATARPRRLLGGFLAGAGRPCRLVGDQHGARPKLIIEQPEISLGSYAHSAHWSFVCSRLAELAARPGTMLVFCNTRAHVERLAAMLEQVLPEDQLAVHHGSVGRDRRETVEQNLKQGRTRLVVCSSSLELGIDVGALERVCQIGAPPGINEIRQRAGRARHRPGLQARLHAFPLTMNDLLDWEALDQALTRQALDVLSPCREPIDVLSQHLVAMVAAGQACSDQLYATVTRAWPWRRLRSERFERVIDMLHHGFVPGRETATGPLLRLGSKRLGAGRDAARRALLNAGTIPEWFEYEVLAPALGRRLGRLDEEFAFESSPGQILQLGGESWRILRVLPGRVEVEAAADEVPNLPFWFGDGAGRSNGLSLSLRLLCERANQGRFPPRPELGAWLEDNRAHLQRLPDRRTIVIERFFDPIGDQHLVIHSLFGARVNRAWGLALRKRFCRGFNFELQAAATDNGILISLGAVHSFALDEVVAWLSADGLPDLLVQALLDTPVFQTRLRWCANNALAIERRDLHGRVPAQIQRSQTENLISRIFPDQLACLENLAGPRQIPDHPLVEQALADCLQGHLDLAGLVRLYQALESGRIQVHSVDGQQPSAMAMALVHAPRSSFLDPAAAEERRTRSFEQSPDRPLHASRNSRARQGSVAAAATPGWQKHGDLEHALLAAGYLLPNEAEQKNLGETFLRMSRRGQAVSLWIDRQRCLWMHQERLGEGLALWPKARIQPYLSAALRPEPIADSDEALCRLLIGRCRLLGSLSARRLAMETGLSTARIESALLRLQLEGLLWSELQAGEPVWRERKPQAISQA